jgi:hypothetical protein
MSYLLVVDLKSAMALIPYCEERARPESHDNHGHTRLHHYRSVTIIAQLDAQPLPAGNMAVSPEWRLA